MSISSFAAARYIGKLSNWSRTNLELQKILYIANMFHLGRNHFPLVHNDEKFEAWLYGPVLPDLYHLAKGYGAEPVEDIFFNFEFPDNESTESEILNSVYKLTQNFSASRLVAITHWKQGAWVKRFNPKRPKAIITNEDILYEYEARIRRAAKIKEKGVE